MSQDSFSSGYTQGQDAPPFLSLDGGLRFMADMLIHNAASFTVEALLKLKPQSDVRLSRSRNGYEITYYYGNGGMLALEFRPSLIVEADPLPQSSEPGEPSAQTRGSEPT